MPSLRHRLLAEVVPRLRKSSDLPGGDDPAAHEAAVAAERARIEQWHAGLDRALPTRVVPRFAKRFSVVREELPAGFASYTISERGVAPRRTAVWLHGGGFVAPIDPFHVRYAARLAGLGFRVVVPDYPLAPEHTWADSHDALVALVARHVEAGEEVVLGGDSAGGGIALAVAQTLRDRGTPPAKLVLVSPWVDLTESTPETAVVTEDDPWLYVGKLRAYAAWWAGSDADLGRPEVSPALADLAGLPPALMFFGTRDTLLPGGRLLARRAAEAGWPLTYVEEPGLLHVYPALPLIPEAQRAWRQTEEFLA